MAAFRKRGARSVLHAALWVCCAVPLIDARITHIVEEDPTFLGAVSRLLATSAAYNGNGTCPATGNAAPEAATDFAECAEFETNACCTVDQVDALVDDFNRIKFLIRGAACRETIRRIFCYETCSPHSDYAVSLEAVLTEAPGDWPGGWVGPEARHLKYPLCASHCTKMYEDCKDETLLGSETIGSQFDEAGLCEYLSSETAANTRGIGFSLGPAGCSSGSLASCGPLLEMYQASGSEKCFDAYNPEQYPVVSPSSDTASDDVSPSVAGANAFAAISPLLFLLGAAFVH